MFALRRATGIRLTRRSSLARRSCAWRAYCARSLRALSVTAMVSVNSADQDIKSILSSCRLSIRDCFWLRVIRIRFLGGVVFVGVASSILGYASSISPDFRLVAVAIVETKSNAFK